MSHKFNPVTAPMDPKKDPFPLISMPPLAIEGERVVALDVALFLGPDGPLPMVGVTHLQFADFDAAAMACLRPSLILFPLFAALHDAIAVIEVLTLMGYTGRMTVLAPDLPNPRLVERELRGLGPGNRLTLISP